VSGAAGRFGAVAFAPFAAFARHFFIHVNTRPPAILR
jgi:hypothetical protein